MRMWNVDPKLLCRQHLLGEHLEMHMFIGCIQNGKSINGYINNGLVEVDNIIKRHDKLANEIIRRRWNHKSPINGCLQQFLWEEGNVNSIENLKILREKCDKCKQIQNEFLI